MRETIIYLITGRFYADAVILIRGGWEEHLLTADDIRELAAMLPPEWQQRVFEEEPEHAH